MTLYPGPIEKTKAAARTSALSNQDVVEPLADSKTSDGRLTCADRAWLYITRFDCLVGLPLDDDWGGEKPGRTLAYILALGAALVVVAATLACLELPL